MDFARYLGEAPPPSIILNVHAAVFVLWLGLVTLQILWVEIGNLRRHKQLGWLTVAVSALMVPLGAFLWAGEIVATILNFSPTWREIMVRLVNAWGYAG